MEEANELLPTWDQSPIAEPVTASTTFAIPRARTSKLIVPRADGDNLEKAIYDLLERKGYLEDDKWITEGHWTKKFVPYGETGFTTIVLTSGGRPL